MVHRFVPRVNPEVNDYWMCDHGRFLAESLNGRDFLKPVLAEGAARRETNWGEALDLVAGKVKAAVATRPESVVALGSANLSTEENWLLAQLFGKTAGSPNVEFQADEGPLRRIPNAKAAGAVEGFLKGTVAAPNATGAEAAGVKNAGAGSALEKILAGKLAPEVLYVADAAFTTRADDPAFVAKLRKAKLLVVHARTKNALTDAADVVLPVQRFDEAFVPPPIVKSDLEVLLHLGKRFGAFETRWTAAVVFAHLADSVPAYQGLTWDAPAVVGNAPSITPAASYDVLLAPRTNVDATDRIPAVAAKA